MSDESSSGAQRAHGRLAAVTEVVSELSGFAPDELEPAAEFLELGFDSLFLTQLGTALEQRFGAPITFRQLFDELPTIAAVAEHLDAALPPLALEPPPEEEPVAPTEPQSQPAPSVEIPATVPSGGVAAVSADLPPMPSRAASRPTSGSGLERVFSYQLELMTKQIELLAGASSASQVSVPAVASVQQPAASTDVRQPVEVTAQQPVATSQGSNGGFGPAVGTAAKKPCLSNVQQEGLERLVARYAKKTAGSKERTQRHRERHADPRTAAGFDRHYKEIVYPIWVERSRGSRLWDVDGNEYIDLLNGFGPNFLGHSAPGVVDAVKEQLERGFEIGPQTPLAGEVAELICELTGMDRASFMCTGSEAVQAAIRVARTVTGRDKIVVFKKDYHGNFDEVLVRAANSPKRLRTMPLAPGIPTRAVEDVLTLDYGSDEALEIIEERADEIAAVLVEPVQSRRPELQPVEFLRSLRRICTERDVVLHFDEVITGFRCALGGAQEVFGIEADLATYGKVLGGGLPIGVLAGRRRFMDTLDGGHWQYGDDSFPEAGVTFFAGTFIRHPLSIAAAHATLRYLKDEGPALQRRVNDLAAALSAAAGSLFERFGAGFELPHFSSLLFLRNSDSNPLSDLLFFHLRERGVHLLEGFPCYLTAAHTHEDVDEVIRALESSLEEMSATKMIGAVEPEPEGVSVSGWTQESFPLTPGQREIWYACQLGDEASCAFNESDSLRLRGALDVDLLRDAVQAVIGRHQAFSLTFDVHGERQTASKPTTLEVPLIDLSKEESAKAERKLRRLLSREAATPFDLVRGPLVRARIVRLQETEHLLVLYAHHLVFDGWSSGVVFAEIGEVYAAAVERRAPELLAPTPYAEFARVQQEHESSGAAAKSRSFWAATLQPLPPPLELPGDAPRPVDRHFDGATVKHVFDPKHHERLKEGAAELRISMFVLLLAGFKLQLSRLAGQTDFATGVSLATQALTGKEALVGHGVSFVPLRSGVTPSQTFRDLLGQTKSQVLDLYDYPHCSIGSLLPMLPVDRTPGRSPLVDVLFNYATKADRFDFGALVAEIEENRRQYVTYDLYANVLETGDGLTSDWDFSCELFDELTVRRWMSEYEQLTLEVVERPDTKLADLGVGAEPIVEDPAQTESADGELTAAGRSSSSSEVRSS